MSAQWPIVKLGEVIHEEREQVKSLEGDGLPVLGVTNEKGVTQTGIEASEDKSKYLRLRPGRFAYNPYRINVGSIGLSSDSQDGICSPAYVVFVPGERIHARYLWFFLKSARGNQLINYLGNRGSVRSALRFIDLCKIELPLPSPSEQQRVVACIEELNAQILEAHALRQRAAEEAKALSNASARLLLSEIAERLTPLSDWLHPGREGIQTGPFGAQLSNSEFTDSGVPLLTISNVQYCGLDSRELKYVSPSKADQLSRYRVYEGDILFARMGTVGRCCVVPKQSDGWLINYHIIRVALDVSRVESRFIHWTIQASADIESYLDDKIRGATRKGVNSRIVAALPCRVPALSEQRRIVTELDALQAEVDRLKSLQSETAAELDALLPAILDRAFKGEL